MFRQALYCVLGLQLLLAILMMLCSDRLLPPLSHHMKQRREDDSIIYFNVITIGTLLWGIIWCQSVGMELIQRCPWALIGLLWPIALGVFQLYDIYYDRCEDIQTHQQQRVHLIGGIHIDTSTIISFAFACATFFWAIGNISSKQNLIPSARIIVIALLLCIGLIVPTQHFVDNNQRYSTYVRVSQRVTVNYAMGLLITALIIVLTNCVTMTKSTTPVVDSSTSSV